MKQDETVATPTLDAPAADGTHKLWRVGTLTYNRGQLFGVFFWLLWGDFCLNVMESVIPRLVPLQLEKLGASNELIAMLTVTIFSAMNWVMNPVISTWSDRHRGPRGRRIPFMFWPTPPLAFFVISVGFAANVGAYVVHRWPGVAAHGAAAFGAVLPMAGIPWEAQFAVGMVAVALVCYRFFDQFPQCVYYYIWADVIPQHLMGRFTSLFRVIATLGGVVFHAWILKYADTHPGMVYLGCGLLYLVAFMLMCLMVEEGEYPPPPQTPKGAGRSWRTVLAWFRECFSLGYYWKYYFAFACFRWAYVPFNALIVVYATKSVGMDAGEFGHRMAIVMAVQMPVFLLLGPIVDYLHPVRVGMVGYASLAAAGGLAFCFTKGPTTFLVWMVAAYVAIAICQGAIVSLTPRLLPRSRYGQFCAATMMVVELGMLSMSWRCGQLMDFAGESVIWLWLAGFALLGLVAMAVLYRGWLRHGGDEAYQAPGDFDEASSADGAFEVVAKH